MVSPMPRQRSWWCRWCERPLPPADDLLFLFIQRIDLREKNTGNTCILEENMREIDGFL